MPVDVLGDPKKINIQELVLNPDRRQEADFDPKKDISPHQWNMMKGLLNREHVAPQDKIFMMACLKVLDPKIELPDTYAQIKSGLSVALKSSPPFFANDRIFSLRVLYPEKFKEIYPYERDRLEHFNFLNDALKKYLDSMSQSRLLITIATSFPGDLKRISDWKPHLEEEMEKHTNHPLTLAYLAAAARILYPDCSWQKYFISPSQWKIYKDQLEKMEQNVTAQVKGFAYYAVLLTILSAEKIDTSKKVFIIRGDEKTQEISDFVKPLPERRKY